MWVLTHRPLHKLDGAAVRVQFLEEQDLVDVLARQPIWRSDDDAVELGQRHPVAHPVESGSAQARSAVANIAEHSLLGDRFTLSVDVSPQALQLLLNSLRLGLST